MAKAAKSTYRPEELSKTREAFGGTLWPALLIFALLSVLVFIFWRILEDQDQDNLEDKVRTEANYLASRIEADLRNRIPAIRRMTARWSIRGAIPREEFESDARSYLSDVPGFQALEWVDERFVVRWVVPLAGNERAVDLNLGFELQRRLALEKARISRSPSVTHPVDLVQGGMGFLIYFPIYVHDDFRGFIVAVFHIDEWLDFSLGISDKKITDDFDLAVVFDAVDVYRSKGWDASSHELPIASAETRVLDLTLDVRVEATPAFAAANHSTIPIITAAVGFLLSAMMAFIVRLALRMNAVSRMTEKARSALEEEVAARRRTEEALRGSEERVRLLLNSTAESIYGIDLEGRCTFANPACARVLGYPDADSFLGKNMHALIHHSYPDGGAMVEESCRIFRAFREGAGVHCDDEVLWRSDGTSFPAEYWSYPQFREGRTVGAVVTFLDITERKRAEKALADASRNLESQVEERTRSLRDAHERIMEQRLLEHDLQVAGQAQINLLPKGLPVIEGFDLVTVARPARLVSGDFFDYQVFGARFCSILLADIAGKGLPSALLAASARSLYRRALLAGADRSKGVPPGPEELLDELNREMLPDLERSERFLTMIAARLDLGTGALEIANAGGCKVIVFDAATHESRTLEEGGLPMGIFAALGGTKETVGLRPGMGAVFYSDGITEAVDPKGELFGLERLLAEVNRGAHLGPDELAQRTLAAVEAFQAGLPLSDDLSLIVLKAKPRRWRASFATSLASLDEVPLRVAEACFSYGAAVARDLELVVSEMLSNIREHGYAESEGPVELELRCETRGVELVIREWGRTFDMSALSPPPLGTAEEGGFGLFLIREVMEHFSYEPGGADGNLWIGFRSI